MQATMKAVRINERYLVEVEPSNLTLKEVRTSKKGDEVHVTHGYYGSWEHVLGKLIRLTVYDALPDDTTVSLSELKAIYISVKEELSLLIEPLKE